MKNLFKIVFFPILTMSSLLLSDNESILKEKIVYVYEINKNLKRLKSETIHKYNIGGYKVESIEYNFKNEIQSKTTYQYDEKDNIIKETCSSPESVYLNKYDSNNNLIEVVCPVCSVNRTIYEYDKERRLTKSIKYDKSGNTDITGISTYKYDIDSNDNVLVTYGYEGDYEYLVYKNYSKYDSNGNNTEQTIYHLDELITKYQDQYDHNNKFVESYSYKYLNDELYSTSKSVFEYIYY